MCGIAGALGKEWGRAQLQAMADVQSHRGPDGQGIYVSADGQAGLRARVLLLALLNGFVNGWRGFAGVFGGEGPEVFTIGPAGRR